MKDGVAVPVCACVTVGATLVVAVTEDVAPPTMALLCVIENVDVGVFVCVAVTVTVELAVPICVGVAVCVNDGVAVDVILASWEAELVVICVVVLLELADGSCVDVDDPVGDWLAVRAALGVADIDFVALVELDRVAEIVCVNVAVLLGDWVCVIDGYAKNEDEAPSCVVQLKFAPDDALGEKGQTTVAFPPEVGCASIVVTHETLLRVARTGGTGASAVIVHVVKFLAKSKAQGPRDPTIPQCAAGITARTICAGVFSAIQTTPLLSQPTPNATVRADVARPPVPVTPDVPVPAQVVMVLFGNTRRMRAWPVSAAQQQWKRELRDDSPTF